MGVVSSLFRDRPQWAIDTATKMLVNLMETQTGLKGQIKSVGEADKLGRMLQEGKLDLTLFHGFEFAWAKAKHPELLPLVLVSNRSPLRACLVVRKDSKVTSIEDLKGKYVAVPVTCRGHCHLFLERRCCPAGQKPAQFFKKVTTPIKVSDALGDVLADQIAGTVVEHDAFEDFCRSAPERASHLKVLLQSETFPSGVVAYHPGKLSAEIVKRMREGLLNAQQTKQGKELLETCQMGGFENVPADFPKALEDIAKAYPDLEAK
jgi:ABC-type phosphate/phosphonate transport system substrate-binding protein